jgi:putative membrane protein insertion efficiency factor
MLRFFDSIFRALAIFLIRGYQLALSPFFGGACRFSPTCSAYAADAFTRFSAPRALWLTIRRLARCHPFCAGGFDPLPDSPRIKNRR